MLQMTYNGGTETRTYNTMFQLTNISGLGQNITYNFPAGSNNGKIASQSDAISGETLTYQYDSLNRLISAAGSGWSQTYSYDGFGNLTGKTGTGTAQSTTISIPADPATNRLSGYGYDANGNLLSTGNLYDVENRLRQANMPGGTIQYAYDGQNKRIWQGQFTNSNDPQMLMQETVAMFGADGKLAGNYTPQPAWNNTQNQVAITFTGSTRVYFAGKLIKQGGSNVVQDRLGSVGKYYPYGEERNSPPLGNDQVKFATYTRDSATGLDYADQRYHTSTFGRFTTPDPYKASAGANDPGSWNRYSYVSGDPVNYNDPAGLATCSIISVFSTSDPDSPDFGSTAEVACISVGSTVWEHFSVSGYDGNWKQLIADSENTVGAELDNAELRRVADIAIAALSERSCNSLFSFSTDPGAVFDALVRGLVPGSSLGFGDLGAPSGGLATAAETRGILGHQVINGINTSIFTGATITINSNGLAPWVTGYPDRFGFGNPTSLSTQDLYRAITLIHELGHYYNTVTGMGGSAIADDNGNPVLSQAKTKLVVDNCFAFYAHKN